MKGTNFDYFSDEGKKNFLEKEYTVSKLSDRMGMNHIRDELEDLSFQELNPEARKLVLDRLKLNKFDRDLSFKKITLNFLLSKSMH